LETKVACKVIKTQYFIIVFDNCQGFHTEPHPTIPPSKSIPLLPKEELIPSELTMKVYFLYISAILRLQLWRYDYDYICLYNTFWVFCTSYKLSVLFAQ
jgi:hypothetical protein